MYNLKDIPITERPRERMMISGSSALSNVELFAILLSSGTKQTSVMEIACKIVERYPSLDMLTDVTINELKNIKGIGKAKAISLLAAIELGKRINKPNVTNPVISTSKDAYLYLKDEMQNLKQEHLVCLYLNTKCHVISKKIIAIGGGNYSTVNPKEILKWGIKESACGIILSHNHPSGDSTPSKEDVKVTKRIIEAASSVDIVVCDHIIIGKDNYFSFKEKGEILGYSKTT